MSDPIRVGVVGTSGYTDFMHLPSLKSHPQAAISARRTSTIGIAAKLPSPERPEKPGL